MKITFSTTFNMTKRLWTFVSELTDDEVSVEAEGFEEASNLMFGEHEDNTLPYDYKEYILLEVEDLN